jgi:hypothetical protein
MTGIKVHLAYWLYKDIWHYQFIGPGLAVLGPVFSFLREPDIIRGIAERGGGIKNQEAAACWITGSTKAKAGYT